MSDDMALAWAAGLFDGEGSIGLQRAIVKKSVTFIVTLGMTNTNLLMLKRFHVVVGKGSIHTRTTRRSEKHQWRWDWSASSRDAEVVLKKLRPYLFGKAAQAEMALEARALIQPWGGKHARPQRSLDELERLRQALKAEKRNQDWPRIAHPRRVRPITSQLLLAEDSI